MQEKRCMPLAKKIGRWFFLKMVQDFSLYSGADEEEYGEGEE
jgi:hypothetical protein